MSRRSGIALGRHARGCDCLTIATDSRSTFSGQKNDGGFGEGSRPLAGVSACPGVHGPYRRGRTAAPSRRTPHGSLVEALGAVDTPRTPPATPSRACDHTYRLSVAVA